MGGVVQQSGASTINGDELAHSFSFYSLSLADRCGQNFPLSTLYHSFRLASTLAGWQGVTSPLYGSKQLLTHSLHFSSSSRIVADWQAKPLCSHSFLYLSYFCRLIHSIHLYCHRFLQRHHPRSHLLRPAKVREEKERVSLQK